MMKGMTKLGELFEKGEVYLPQLIRSSEVMNRAVEIITPYLEKNLEIKAKGKIVMATVEGDVHDIGKNIVGTVLKCNDYEIIDLGVMVSKEKILQAALENSADAVTLSGLISPSLKEMEKVLEFFQQNGMTTPILIAGATTSALHTALKLEPLYVGKTLHVLDAVDTLQVINSICSNRKESFCKEKIEKLYQLKKLYLENKKKESSEVENLVSPTVTPKKVGIENLEITLTDLERYINLDILLHTLKVKGTPEEERTLKDIEAILTEMKNQDKKVHCVFGIFPSKKVEGKLFIENTEISNSQDLYTNLSMMRIILELLLLHSTVIFSKRKITLKF